MRKKPRFFVAACLFISASLPLLASGRSAEAPDTLLSQKEAVVAVYVNDKRGEQLASSSGVIIDRSGVIATSCYLIPQWLESIENTLLAKGNDGAESPLEYLLSNNCSNGIALIKVRGDAFPAMKIASDPGLKKGELVSVISAIGTGITVAEGRVRNSGGDERFQVSVHITPRQDGSPVLNAKGEVIGIAAFRSVMKRERPYIVPSKNILKEFHKYRHLIKETPPPSETPRIPFPPPVSTLVPRQQKVGKETDAERYFTIGQSYEKTNMTLEAIEAYKEAVRNKPDFLEAYVNLGLAYYKVEKYREAVEAYAQAIKIKPALQSVYNKLGATYIILGEYAKALDAFKQSVKIDPKNSETHFNLGVAFVIAGDKSGAIEEYLILKDLDRKWAEKLLEFIY